ncbi:hypothetical protein DFJ58DRAFT_752068 [Suillus subalutaceus]|uniref:uncharacterized protein n=1 Tax=Suillus subalutaceus TaxID=48586 RepID=UPI001B85BA5C|nr:uncharacterized protein DFJ58DRAFT_752068 [Suillus subalutaceus]KAG1877645.1 hypothetical protein DFJ58DRAFT_752068 [Suillus subalutaceus]
MKHANGSFAPAPPTASFIARVHRLLLPTEAPSLLRIRFQIINIWPVNWPIALCNSRSVDFEKDSVPVALIYADLKIHESNEPGRVCSYQMVSEITWGSFPSC